MRKTSPDLRYTFPLCTPCRADKSHCSKFLMLHWYISQCIIHTLCIEIYISIRTWELNHMECMEWEYSHTYTFFENSYKCLTFQGVKYNFHKFFSKYGLMSRRAPWRASGWAIRVWQRWCTSWWRRKASTPATPSLSGWWPICRDTLTNLAEVDIKKSYDRL